MPPSKTARRSTPSSVSGGFNADAGANRLISLNSGKNAYVWGPTGKLGHYEVGTERFEGAVDDLIAALGADRIRAEISNHAATTTPSWASIIDRLDERSAETGEEA